MINELYNDDFLLSKYCEIDGQVFIKRQYKVKGDYTQILSSIKSLNSKYLKKVTNITYKNDFTYYYEEYVDGIKLSELSTCELTKDDVKKIMVETLNAIRDLHSIDVIHRDINPSNIIVDKNYNVILIDYDIAKKSSFDEKGKDTVLLGTEDYSAPENFGFGQTNIQSDIYSFGKTFENLVNDKYGDYKDILKKCTEINKNFRFNNTDEILEILSKNHVTNYLFSIKFLINSNIFTGLFLVAMINTKYTLFNMVVPFIIGLVISNYVCLKYYKKFNNKRYSVVYKILYIVFLLFYYMIISALYLSIIGYEV